VELTTFSRPASTASARESVFNRIESPRKRHSSDAHTSRCRQGSDETSRSSRRSQQSRSKDKETSRKPTTPEEKANRSKSDEDDEIMVLDPWDVPPCHLSADTSPTDSKDNEKAIQALVNEAAAKVRAEFLKSKKARKEKWELKKVTSKKKH